MKYYESTLRLRIPSTDLYGIHQHLDFFIQEQSKAKLPYSFLVQPGTGNDSRILLRTAQPIGVPGEKHLSATFTGVSLDIENYCTLRLFFDLPNLAGLSRRNLPADGIRLLFHI